MTAGPTNPCMAQHGGSNGWLNHPPRRVWLIVAQVCRRSHDGETPVRQHPKHEPALREIRQTVARLKEVPLRS